MEVAKPVTQEVSIAKEAPPSKKAPEVDDTNLFVAITPDIPPIAKAEKSEIKAAKAEAAPVSAASGLDSSSVKSAVDAYLAALLPDLVRQEVRSQLSNLIKF